MKPVIQSLIVKRFRSIRSAHVELDNPTFLVGENGAGKSNLVDAFAFLAEAMTSPLNAVFDRRGGFTAVRNRTPGRGDPSHLGIGVVLGPIGENFRGGRYALEVKARPHAGYEIAREQCLAETPHGRAWFDRTQHKFRSSVTSLQPGLKPSTLALPVIGGNASFNAVYETLAALRVYALEPVKIRRLQEPDGQAGLYADGSNAASVLQEIGRRSKDDAERIAEILATILPHTRRVRAVKRGKLLTLECTQEWGNRQRLKVEAAGLSDGTLRALGLLLAVYQRPTPSLLVIEEPETTMPPPALSTVLDVLRPVGRTMQLVVTTHSPEVLDAEWLEARNVRIVSWQEGATHVAPLSQATQQALAERLMSAGELYLANALRAEEPLPDIDDSAPCLFEELE